MKKLQLILSSSLLFASFGCGSASSPTKQSHQLINPDFSKTKELISKSQENLSASDPVSSQVSNLASQLDQLNQSLKNPQNLLTNTSQP